MVVDEGAQGPVNSIALRGNDAECVSASSDGSCIVWDPKPTSGPGP